MKFQFPRFSALRYFSLPVLACSILAFGVAEAKPKSTTFQDSCRSWKLEERNGQLGIAGSCRKIDGSYQNSFVELRSIENLDGHMTMIGGGPLATFHRTCRDMSLHKGTEAGMFLIGYCQTKKGDWQRSWIPVWEIENRDGQLTYHWR